MLTIPEGESRPPTTEELLGKVPAIPSAHGDVGLEPKASALCGPISMPRGKAIMSEKEKVDARIDAIREIFSR
jgi:hypothetical protein